MKRKKQNRPESTPPNSNAKVTDKGNEVIISIFALIVSLVSLAISFYYSYRQTEITKEFNSLTTMPKIQFLKFNHSDMFSIKKNTGVGPAIIDDIILTFNNGKSYNLKSLNTDYGIKS